MKKFNSGEPEKMKSGRFQENNSSLLFSPLLLKVTPRREPDKVYVQFTRHAYLIG